MQAAQAAFAAQIAQEEDAWRASEVGGEGSQSMISGYGKGKVLEKCMCMNCLRRALSASGMRGAEVSLRVYILYIYILTSTQSNDREILPAMSE